MIALCGALAICCIVLAARLVRLQRRQRNLTGRLEDFLAEGGAPLPPSTQEDELSRLQETVSQLQSRLLVAEERRAEESLRAGNLTADISHQLKTPLASLKLYCELDGGPHLSGQLQQIERMEDLIHALLRLEKLSADGYRFTFAEYDLRTLAEDAWQSLAADRQNRRFEIIGGATARCDAMWLAEALGNLLKNACEHTGEDGQITVRIVPSDTAVFVSVEDDGGGVPAEAAGRLFERFYRSENASGTGSGLGLSIAREIIRHHHGTISAENTGQGLRITFSLPLLSLAKS